jgi:hypothetical protein
MTGIEQFCHADKSRWCATPFRMHIGGVDYLCATDGVMLAAERAEVPEGTPACLPANADGVTAFICGALAASWPPVDAELLALCETETPCGECEDRLTYPCKLCSGSSQKSCTCPDCGNDHHTDCDCLDGVARCGRCAGPESRYVVVFDQHFNSYRLRRALRWVGSGVVNWAVASPHAEARAIGLKGEGRLVVLMPMLEPTADVEVHGAWRPAEARAS